MNNVTSREIDRKETAWVGQQDDRLAILVLYISIFVVGLIENSLVLVVIFGKKESKTVNDIFITNFTISDIAFITVASPLSVYIYFVQQYGSTYLCKFGFPMITATYFVSIATVASMTKQRYFAIWNSFKPQIKKHTLIMWSVGRWCLSVVSTCYSADSMFWSATGIFLSFLYA